jgi:hypothetical protein
LTLQSGIRPAFFKAINDRTVAANTSFADAPPGDHIRAAVQRAGDAP